MRLEVIDGVQNPGGVVPVPVYFMLRGIFIDCLHEGGRTGQCLLQRRTDLLGRLNIHQERSRMGVAQGDNRFARHQVFYDQTAAVA